MKKTTRTILAFDETQLDAISKLKDAFSGEEVKEISNRELFLIAMAVGFNSKNKFDTIQRSNTGARIEYIEKQPEDSVLFCALQIAEHDKPESLLDIEQIYDLAECYAAGGFGILYHALETHRNFEEWFQGLIFQNLDLTSDQ
jgi:hypothetical protein